MKAVLWLAFLVACAIAIFFLALPDRHVYARDDGRYANSPLKEWFDHLQSGKGLCCSIADGRTIDDPDIDTDGQHYRVRIDGEWLGVPDEALVTVPNKLGRAVVWPLVVDGKMTVRCFRPGAGI